MKPHARFAGNAALLVAGTLAFACTSRDEQPPGGLARVRQALISDQVHSAGKQGFFFLPPMVPPPATEGTFDGTQDVVVSVHELDPASGAVLATIGTWSKTAGTDAERVTVRGKQYQLLWKTSQYVLNTAHIYRIKVEVAAGSSDTPTWTPSTTGRSCGTWIPGSTSRSSTGARCRSGST